MINKEYFRLVLVVAVIGIAAAAHMLATVNFGYTRVVTPIYKGDSIGVAGTAGNEELSVGYSTPATLAVGVEEETTVDGSNVRSTDPQATPTAAMDGYAPTDSAKSLNASSSAKNSIPMPKDFKYELPPKVDLSSARL